MPEVSGDFEIHITAFAGHSEKLASFAARHGLKFVHILLDQGGYASQPMVTLTGRGSLADQHAVLGRWQGELSKAAICACRSKIEAAPWCVGVPQSDEQAATEPQGRYFEHHIKLLLPGATATDLVAVANLVLPHGARLSRNARRVRTDGVQERFVTQRCHGVGLGEARRRLDALVDAVRSAGHQIVEVEQEYVVFDSDLRYDQGWLEPRPSDARTSDREHRMRSAPGDARDYPPTYQPLPAGPHLRQRAAFDPAVKHYPNAYRAGEPEFLDRGDAIRWKAARQTAMSQALTAIVATPWAEHLVLRGSVTMSAWVGAAARDPGDLDFVVTPHTITSDSRDAAALLRDVKAALRTSPGAGLRPDQITETAIWTYERADGRRLVVPFAAPDLPDGYVQLDIVFGERLPLPPEPLVLPGVDRPVPAASASLSLAWKLLWLASDWYPQGKDLYDAVLLAEHATVGLALVRDMMRPELGSDADTFTPETVLTWDVDWNNFTDEYHGIAGTADDWKERLALALDRAWT